MNIDRPVKEKARVSFTVPAGAGSYALEEIIFGVVASGEREQSFSGVTALVEALPASAVVELWLPRVEGADKAHADFTALEYFVSGQSLSAAGYASWTLWGYPGAKIRVKSGGTSGTATVSATAV